ncbi:MAG: MBL fold metallo-hydrolase [Oscillospiraceae bacterium]|nr:MBL fold metallo-hydrolase [Oscillospiraceae bacterium]
MAEILEISTCSLSSGSSGNCIFAACGETYVLFDAGRSAKAMTQLLSQISVKIQDINAIFITHEHIDHVNGLKVLINRYKIPVYMVWESFDNLSGDYKSALGEVINFISPKDKIIIGDMQIECYPTPHDSAASVGYIIGHKHNSDKLKKAVGIATDIGYMTKEITEAMCGCRIIYIESNHDLEMLKNSSYPAQVKQRIKSKRGHLSNTECAEILPYFIKNGARKIILYHLSGENNTKELAVKESKKSILDAKLKVGTVYLGVAPRSSPSKMVSVKISLEINQNENPENPGKKILNPLNPNFEKKVLLNPKAKRININPNPEIPEIDADNIAEVL